MSKKDLINLARKHHIPGFSIQIIDDFKLGDYFSFGLNTDKKPINKNTLFQAASLSKTVTAIIALRLCEEKKLKLGSIRSLLSHTAGMSVNGFAGYEATDKIPTLDQIIKGLSPANSKAIVKKYHEGKYRYSGGGYMLIQKMMEDATGKSFESLAKQYVFKPLSMKRSTFRLIYPGTKTNIARGSASRKMLANAWKIHPESAAAALWSTPTEMARLVLDLMCALSGQKSLFSPWLVRTMIHPVVKGVGLGTFVHLTKEGMEFSHSGANVGYRSRYVGSSNGKGFVVMVNSGDGFGFIDKVYITLNLNNS